MVLMIVALVLQNALNLSVFNMITGIYQSITFTKHANVNVSLMVEDVIQIKCGIRINVDVSVKI